MDCTEVSTNQINYNFNMIIIKPNSSNLFQEDIYKLANYPNDKPIENITELKNILLKYLQKKDFFEIKKMSFNEILFDIDKFFNPANYDTHRYDTRTCFNSKNELIMFICDESIPKHISQFNHIITLFSSNFESVFGPVFITKMLKDEDGRPYKHVDMDLEDLVDMWIQTKQVKYWQFDENTNDWKVKYMMNNNKSIDAKLYKYINIDTSLIFYKLKNDTDLLFDVKTFLIENVNNAQLLSTYFEDIKICALKTGEYSNVEMNYNADISYVQDYIVTTALNGINDYEKYQVVMESIFRNIDECDKIIF